MAADWKVCLQLLTAVFLFKNELSAATHLTSRLLKEYDKQVGQVSSHQLHDTSHHPCDTSHQSYGRTH